MAKIRVKECSDRFEKSKIVSRYAPREAQISILSLARGQEHPQIARQSQGIDIFEKLYENLFCYNFRPQNRNLLEKLTYLKKKIISIGRTVQKLFKFKKSSK